MSEIDVSEEAVELVCGRLALSEKVLSHSLPASNCGKAQDMLRELRRQLTEKESQLQRAVLEGVKAGIEACRDTASGYQRDPVAFAIDCLIDPTHQQGVI